MEKGRLIRMAKVNIIYWSGTGNTAAMAAAVGQSPAKRILVPVNHCDNYIVGVTDLSMAKLIEGVVTEVGKLIG